MIDLEQDVFLELNILELLIFNDNILADTLHGIDLLGLLVLHQVHLPESALSDHAHYNKVLEPCLAIS